MYIEKVVVGQFAVNCYMVMCEETKEAIIIDPGDYLHLILKMIKRSEAKVKYIVLTHGHGDHIGAVLPLKEATGAKILVSEDEDELLSSAVYNESARICSEPIEIQADIFARDNDEYILGNLAFKVIKTPGHTKGGMCVLIGQHLFTGDTLFRTSVGRTDLHGGNMQTLVNSIAYKLFALDENIIVYPGHGAKSSIGFEKQNNPFI